MEELLKNLPNFGLAGLVIAGLVLAVRSLWVKYDEVQNARITEGLRALEIIKANTISLDINTQNIKALGDIIRAQKGWDTK